MLKEYIDIINFLVSILFILRFLLPLSRIRINNRIYQKILKFTDPILFILESKIPKLRKNNINLSPLIFALLFIFILNIVLFLPQIYNIVFLLPKILIISIIAICIVFLRIVYWVTLFSVISSWIFPNISNDFLEIIYNLFNFFKKPFQSLPLFWNGIDFSPIIICLLVDIIISFLGYFI